MLPTQRLPSGASANPEIPWGAPSRAVHDLWSICASVSCCALLPAAHATAIVSAPMSARAAVIRSRGGSLSRASGSRASQGRERHPTLQALGAVVSFDSYLPESNAHEPLPTGSSQVGVAEGFVRIARYHVRSGGCGP